MSEAGGHGKRLIDQSALSQRVAAMATHANRCVKSSGIERLVGRDRDLMKQLVQEIVRECLEAEISQALGAEPVVSSPKFAGPVRAGGRRSAGQPFRDGRHFDDSIRCRRTVARHPIISTCWSVSPAADRARQSHRQPAVGTSAGYVD